MLFLAVVVASATLWGLVIALSTAALGFLSWNFFFIPPVGQLTISEPRDVIALAVFAGVAGSTGWLASRVRDVAAGSQRRVDSLRRISAFARSLGEPVAEGELLPEVARLAAEIVSPAVVLMGEGEDLDIRAAIPASLDTMDEGSWAAARWAFGRGEQAGRGTATLPSSVWRFLPMRTARGHVGVLGVRPAGPLERADLQALKSLADQAAAAVERVRLAAAAARAEAHGETQKLRTALLNSLSHDLRTPLTGIRGAAGSLRLSWDSLDAAVRTDLLTSIEEDTVRMTRFLANINEMTRLESGEVTARIEPVALLPLVERVAGTVPGLRRPVFTGMEALPAAAADPALLEQVFQNLLENAAKYGPEGGTVEITGHADAAGVQVTVSDEGPGIPAEDLASVFDSFYRARRQDRTVPGTGLGLAIARGLAEAMGGTIEARSPRIDGRQGSSLEVRLKSSR